MAKIGDFRYPEYLDVEETKPFIDKLVHEFDGSTENREKFAQSLNHKSKSSGAFNKKVADARKYGIMTPRGTYEATELGMHLANAQSETEIEEIFYNMLSNIDLLAMMFEYLNGEEPSEPVWGILVSLLGVDFEEAEEAAGRIKYLYRQMLEYKPETSESDAFEVFEGRMAGANWNKKKEEGADAPQEEAQIAGETVGTHSRSENTQQHIESSRENRIPESAIQIKIGTDELRFGDLSETNLETAIRYLKSKRKELLQEGENTSLDDF